MALTFEQAREWAIDRASDWFLDERGSDRLAEPGVAAGSALRIEVFNVLLPLAVEQAGIASDFGGTGLVGRLKGLGRDRLIRSLGLRLRAASAGGTRLGGDTGVGRRGGRGAPPAARIAFLGEFATPSGLEPMRRVGAALPANAWRAIAGDPRVLARWRPASGPALPVIVPWRDERAIIDAAGRRSRERWAEIRNRHRPIGLDGRDVTRLVHDRIGPLVLHSLPWLDVEREAIRRHVEALRPAWLVLASDQHRLGRLAVDVARQAGARTLVLQHGWPQYRLGYVPVAADRVATWSEAANDWFVQVGAPRDRLVVLGNPRLDRLRAADRRAVRTTEATRLGLEGGPAILLVLSPSDASRNLALLDLALAAIAASPSASLVVKLHPGDGRWDVVRGRVDALGPDARVRIQRLEPIGPLLDWADVTLLHRSTVAIESLAAGTPVAIGAVGADSPGDALPGDLDLPEVADPVALLRLAESVVDPVARAAFAERRTRAVERVSGPLDGQSAARIARFLLAESPAREAAPPGAAR